MQKFVPLDPEAGVSQEHWAVIYVPHRSRNRFSANCVQICSGENEALEISASARKKFAAKVIGPSRSSEGQSIYYLLHWLSEQPPGKL